MVGPEPKGPRWGGQSLVAPLKRVIVKRPEEAFGSTGRIQAEWKTLGFAAPPDLASASAEHRALVALLEASGAEVLLLPGAEGTTLDSIYAHDAGLTTDAGVVVFQTGKPARRGEGPALADALAAWGVPVLGRIDGAATAEGGDMLWLDRKTLVVGRSFRTNPAGVDALGRLLAPLGVRVVEVHLPHAGGPLDLLHLLSIVSPLDEDLVLVHRPLLPVPLFELFQERGFRLIDVADEDVEGMGCNVLAVAPRRLIMLSGCPATRRRLEAAGCRVETYEGREISLQGHGGPTCLTRPLLRAP